MQVSVMPDTLGGLVIDAVQAIGRNRRMLRGRLIFGRAPNRYAG
jgi:hypothetical protein